MLPIIRYAIIAASLPLLVFAFRATTAVGAELSGAPEQAFFVASEQIGDGSAANSSTAANFRDASFWSTIRKTVQQRPVTVNFTNGTYMVSSDEKKGMPTLVLTDLGNSQHSLTLQGVSKSGVIFTRLQSDSSTGTGGPGFLTISQSRNLIIRNLHFTGRQPIAYATHFDNVQQMRIDGCSWVDLPGVEFGATGTLGASTDHVTYTNCVFKRVGGGSGAHMSYNAHGPKHVNFVDCDFEDCAGDYLRYRAGADFGAVVECTFKSTGKYSRGINMPFITVPVFNNDDPLKNAKAENYEYFGSHFLIANNTFSYQNEKAKGERIALLFHHSGFDPPTRNHLLTRDEGQLLTNGSVTAGRALLLRNLGVDTNHVHVFNNRFIGIDKKVAYRSAENYGAKSKGWSGIVEITDLVNDSQVSTLERAEHAAGTGASPRTPATEQLRGDLK